MNQKTIVILIIPLLIISLLLTISPSIPTIPQVHAPLTGTVCIADPASNTCPVTPVLLTPSAPFNNITIGVNINNSAGFNGFDVIIQANHNIIKPWRVDLTNTILSGGAGSILVQCIGGVPKPGTSCSSLDNADTIHLGVSAAGSGTTFPPTHGQLFAAQYNITGSTRNTPIDFKSGCGTPSNPTSDSPICVTINTGTPQPAPETVLRGGFSNLPFYAVDASTASLTVSVGSADSSTTITLTSLNNFNGVLTLTGPIAPATATITTSFLPSLVALIPTSQGTSTMTVTVGATATPGNYNITVIATNTTQSTNSVLIHLIVPAPDFSITSNPTTITINATGSGTAKITLASLNAFAGKVNLTIVPSAGVIASLNVTKLVLKTGGTNSSTLTASASTGGTYTVAITAASTQINHQIIVNVVALDFGITGAQSSISIPQGRNQSFTFSVINNVPSCCFVGNVTLSTSVTTTTASINPSQGLPTTCGPSFALFSTRVVQTADFTCKFKGNLVADYTVVAAGISRGGKSFHAAILTVHVQAPDFIITSTPPTQTIQAGGTANITMVISRQSVFNGTLSLLATVSPAGPVSTFNVTSVTLDSITSTAAVSLKILTATSFQPGTLTVTITVVNGTLPGALTHQTTVSVTVATPSTIHQVAISSVTTDTTSPSIGTKVKYTILVVNQGNFAENVTVVALVGDTTVDQQTIIIQPGTNATVTLTWDTTGWTAGTYVVGAKVLGVSGQRTFTSNIARATTPVTLTSGSQGIFSSGNLSQWTIPIVLIIIVIAGIGVFLFFRYRPRRVTAV